jgi:hypothetical protein
MSVCVSLMREENFSTVSVNSVSASSPSGSTQT